MELFHSGSINNWTIEGHWDDQNRATERTYIVEDDDVPVPTPHSATFAGGNVTPGSVVTGV